MKDAYIRAKERWARKMSGAAAPKPRSDERLPPGQRQVHNFPVLDIGVRPVIRRDQWRLTIRGKVKTPVELDWKAFMDLPQFTDVSDFHCVTTWSQFDMKWTGVSFFTLFDLAEPLEEATHVYFKAYDGYTTNTALGDCLDDDALVAHSWNDAPLSVDHGGPARAIIPKRYAWKGAKFVKEIILMDRDLLGFWELRGYSNTADPFTEDRFA